MKYSEALLLWEPSPDPENKSEKVLVVPRKPFGRFRAMELRFFGHNRAYSGGGAFTHIQDGTLDHNRRHVLIDFVTLVTRDNIDAQAAHAAFCEIQEYRDQLSTDSPVPEKWKQIFRREVMGL